MRSDHGLLTGVRSRLIAQGSQPSSATVAAALRSDHRVVGDNALLQLVSEVAADLGGFGPIDELLDDTSVTDVLVNGPAEVWVDRGEGLQRTSLRFRDEVSLRRLAQRLATRAGRRIDDAQPFVDARLGRGIRMHAVLPPISDRICISLRLARGRAFTLDELVDCQTVARGLQPILETLIDRRLAFLVSGGTGSGKTTVLSSLLGLVDPKSRLIVVEDTSELNPDCRHIVRLEARPANVEGQGQVSLSTLVRQALRMRPDRLVVGEARGTEVVDLLAALNTGHEGGCGTLHANRATDVPARIEALAVGAGLDRAASHSQIAAALHAVLHLSRRTDGLRYISSVSVLVRHDDGLVAAVPAWTVDTNATLEPGPAIERWWQIVA